MNPLRLLPRFREAYRALPMLEARAHWSRVEIETFQLERINQLWQHAVAHVPYYRRLATDTGLPPRFASLEEYKTRMPVLHKMLVRNQPREFLSERAGPGHWNHTSGSTGTPLQVFWSHQAHAEVLRSKYRAQAAWEVDLFDRCLYLWGRGHAFIPGLKGWISAFDQALKDKLRNRIRLSAYDLSHERLRDHLRRMAAFRPAWIYGFSRAVHLLALEAKATGFTCPSLRRVVLTSETISPRLLAEVEDGLAAPTAIEYGSVDCGLLVYQDRDRLMRVSEDTVLLETVSRPDGQYDILVTVLNNPSFPLLRYAIGDSCDTPLEYPQQGFAILRSLLGRSSNLIVSRSGRRLHPSRFEAIFEYELTSVRRFRLHQQKDGGLSLAVELKSPQASLDTLSLQRKLQDLTEGCPVHLSVVDAIPVTAAGKHNPITSDLAGV